jgi:outer membrane protein, protease secretion system
MKHILLLKPLLKLRLKPTLAGAALLSFSIAVWPLDLLQAYEAAKLQDANILATRAATLAGQERLPQARAQMLPSVSLSFTQNRNNLRSVTPGFLGDDLTNTTSYPSSNEALSMRQPLYRPLLTAQYRQAQALVDDANASLAQEEQNLVVRVASAYFEAVLSKEQLTLVLAQQVFNRTQLDAARKIFAAGAGIRTDVDEAQARLDMSLAQEIEARQNVGYTQQQLQILINQPVDALDPLDVAKLELLAPQPARLDDWIARAEQGSPQLRSLKAQAEASREEIIKARAGHLPTLDGVIQVSRSKSDSVTSLRSAYSNATIGLQLNVPLYAGGAVNSAVRQALANQERSEQALEGVRRELGVRVNKELRGMTESIPKIRALEQAVSSADQLVLSSRRSFQAGSRTVIDVLNAEQQRMVVLRDLTQARYVYLISKIRLLALAGDADVEAVRAVNQMFGR